MKQNYAHYLRKITLFGKLLNHILQSLQYLKKNVTLKFNFNGPRSTSIDFIYDLKYSRSKTR